MQVLIGTREVLTHWTNLLSPTSLPDILLPLNVQIEYIWSVLALTIIIFKKMAPNNSAGEDSRELPFYNPKRYIIWILAFILFLLNTTRSSVLKP